MLFCLLKAYARFALWITCRRIQINQPEWLSASGPLLLACNHPNSFLDGIILTTLFRQSVHSLVRGDAFRRPTYKRLLCWLRLLPVYRTSDGIKNLEENYNTFDACLAIFKRGGIVIIFSEGGTKNEWRLRPLRKGTGRLATLAIEQGIKLTVLPVGLNYNAFRNFGKNVFIHFGKPLKMDDIIQHQTDGKALLAFNNQLEQQLKGLVHQIALSDKPLQWDVLGVPQPYWKKILLLIPAIIGLVLHAPLYFPAKAINQHYFDNDHFDSTLFSILALAYPLYIAVISMWSGLVCGWIVGIIVAVSLPLTARACIQLKKQF